MQRNEIPSCGFLYYCYSRNAILRYVTCQGEFFEFEWVFCMSRWAHNHRAEGSTEMIHKNNLVPLVATNEMEALAYAAR
jgi:hypothetical protein